MKTIKDYISTFPESTQEKLWQLYHIIESGAKEAEQTISYGMPAFRTHGKPLVYFAGYKNHIEFYATPTGNEAFINELSKYMHGKGSVQFPLNESLPEDLIRTMVAFRLKENHKKK